MENQVDIVRAISLTFKSNFHAFSVVFTCFNPSVEPQKISFLDVSPINVPLMFVVLHFFPLLIFLGGHLSWQSSHSWGIFLVIIQTHRWVHNSFSQKMFGPERCFLINVLPETLFATKMVCPERLLKFFKSKNNYPTKMVCPERLLKFFKSKNNDPTKMVCPEKS